MKKLKIGALLILVGVLLVSVKTASAILIPAADNAKDKARVDNAPVIEKVEIEGEEHLALTPPGLERIVFIHHKKGFAKPDWAGEGKGKKESKCYNFLGRNVKWQELPVNYVIDPENTDGLSENFVTGAISAGAEEWDAHTGAELFGTYSVDYSSSWDSDAPDGKNELLFGDYPEEGVIAVAVVWGYFSGPPSTRKIIEFDVLFDTDFTWGDATINSTVMDLQNIATHELGHGAGMGDVYETVCSEVTMYGYSLEGEVKKRDLADQDITGIRKLYGGM